MGIFSEFAPKYWSAGLQVMPLRPRSKEAIIGNWPTYSHTLLTSNVKEAWLEFYPDHNIGLCAGPASGVSFIDLDIWDPDLLEKIKAALPPSPWERIGAKGCVLAYKWCNAKSFKLFESEESIKARGATAKKTGVEFFGSTGQVVMPPSIHPDTQAPYTANCPLWEVVDRLQPLDGDQLEALMRKALVAYGVKTEVKTRIAITNYVSKGSRDITMLRLAGMYATDIRKGLRTLQEALGEMRTWGEQFVEYDNEDPVDIDKGQRRIIEFLIRDVQEKHQVLPKGCDNGVTDEQRKALGLEIFTQEYLAMDFDEIKTYFIDQIKAIELNNGRLGDKLKAVEKTVFKLAHSKDVSELETNALFEIMQSTVGKSQLPMGGLRKLLKQHQSVGISGTSHTEIANAVLKDWTDLDVKCDHGRLYEWGGSYWKEKTPEDVMKYIAETYGDLPAARRYGDTTGIYKTLCLLARSPIKTKESKGINFVNGYLNPELRLLPHDKEFGLTYEMPYRWNPNAEAPHRFLKYLQETFYDDPEVIEMLREAIAVTLFGMAPSFSTCFLLYGVPGSGKSVFIDILNGLFPEACRVALSPTMWDDKFKTRQLDGPLLNVAGELSEKNRIDGEIFKKVVDGTRISGEAKWGDPYFFSCQAAQWFASNHLPLTDDTSGGFTRRWRIAKFKRIVKKEDIDLDLGKSIVTEECERIVAWAVPAITQAIARGAIFEPASSEAHLASLSASLNPIRGWFSERIELKEGEILQEDTAYLNYQSYSLTQGFRKLSRTTFRTTMQEQAGTGDWVCEDQRDGRQQYIGIRIKKI